MCCYRAEDEHKKRVDAGSVAPPPPPPTPRSYETSTYGKRQANRLQTPGKAKTKAPTPRVSKKKSPPKSSTKAGRSLNFLNSLGSYMDDPKEDDEGLF